MCMQVETARAFESVLGATLLLGKLSPARFLEVMGEKSGKTAGGLAVSLCTMLLATLATDSPAETDLSRGALRAVISARLASERALTMHLAATMANQLVGPAAAGKAVEIAGKAAADPSSDEGARETPESPSEDVWQVMSETLLENMECPSAEAAPALNVLSTQLMLGHPRFAAVLLPLLILEVGVEASENGGEAASLGRSNAVDLLAYAFAHVQPEVLDCSPARLSAEDILDAVLPVIHKRGFRRLDDSVRL